MRYVNTYGQGLDLAIVAPTIQASNISLVSADEIEFDRGNGSKYLAVVSNSPITFLPFNNVTYSIGDTLSDGSKVIAKGTIDTIDVGSLLPGTWYIRIFELNGIGGTEQYNRSTAALNPTSFELSDEGSFDYTLGPEFE